MSAERIIRIQPLGRRKTKEERCRRSGEFRFATREAAYESEEQDGRGVAYRCRDCGDWHLSHYHEGEGGAA